MLGTKLGAFTLNFGKSPNILGSKTDDSTFMILGTKELVGTKALVGTNALTFRLKVVW